MAKPEELTATQIIRYMDLAFGAVENSDISSHVKDEVLALLEYLRDKEALCRVQIAARAHDWAGPEPKILTG